MPSQQRVRVDADGVRIIEHAPWRRFAWLAGTAIGAPIAFFAVAILVLRLTASPLVVAAPVAEQVASTAPPAGPGGSTAPRVAAPAATASPSLAAASAVHPKPRRRPERGPEPDGERDPDELEIDAADAIQVLRDEGVTGGIAAFGVPGTDPPKPGVIVPEGFELPEGFARHYQTTDDGERLPAILTVHPDYDLIDAQGRIVPRPPGGVVPPELAPSGLPIEMLEVPERRTRTSDPSP
jgi:hypothetical protein